MSIWLSLTMPRLEQRPKSLRSSYRPPTVKPRSDPIAGAAVASLTTGEEALAWCKRQVADVVVTDINLPGKVDGWQIAEHCRKHDPQLPVIYATGEKQVEARPVPGSLSLQKPYDPNEIRAVKEIGERRAPSN